MKKRLSKKADSRNREKYENCNEQESIFSCSFLK